MKTLINNKSILVKIILALAVTTLSILNALSSPARATEITSNNYTNCNVNIISNSYIDNSLTIEKDRELYKFYVDNARNYYLDEEINVTFNDKMEIVDCTVIDKPQIYNTQIDLVTGTIATLKANGQIYLFENIEGLDGWKTEDKCKAIIQDGKLLEVNPIPLNER